MKLTEKLHNLFINFLVRFFPIRAKAIDNKKDKQLFGVNGYRLTDDGKTIPVSNSQTSKTKPEANSLFFGGLLPPGDDEDDVPTKTENTLRSYVRRLARNLCSLENRSIDDESRRVYEGNSIILLRNIFEEFMKLHLYSKEPI